jgi:GGDEF domain-containing protein
MSTTFEAIGREQRGTGRGARAVTARRTGMAVLWLGLMAGSLLALLRMPSGAPASLPLEAVPVMLALVTLWRPLRRLAHGGSAVPARDASTGLYSESGMLAQGEALLARARTGDEAFAMAIFDFADLPEARSIYGAEVRDLLLQKVVRELRAVAGKRGVVGRTGKTEFTLVFPGLDTDDTLHAIRACLGRPASVEFERFGEEIVLVPDLLVQAAATDAFGHSFERWHARARASLTAHQQGEALRRRRVQRDRERHSKPMPVSYEPAHQA